MGDLFVIEAAGKLRTFHTALRALGRQAEVTATLGHLLDNPRTLRPLHVEVAADGRVREPERKPARVNVLRRLQGAVSRCTRVLLATDADAEGHVIAHDVASIADRAKPGVKIERIQFTGLDAGSIGAAIENAAPLRQQDMVPGTARRVADRLIAHAYSDFAQGIYVGRVQSALLGLVAAGEVSRRVATVPLLAADGGPAFVLQCEVPAQISDAEVRSLAAQAAPIEGCGATMGAMCAPMDGMDALLALESDAGLSIDAAAELLQQLYETGQISYPRTHAKAYTDYGRQVVANVASVRGILAFRREHLPLIEGGQGAHEALRLVESSVNLTRPLGLRANAAEAALALIGRRSVAAGVSVLRESGDVSSLPAWAQRGTLQRTLSPVALPWSQSPRLDGAQIQVRSAEAGLVAAMARTGIGRPSTVAGHATRLVRRGLVDADLNLTAKGASAMGAAPAALRDPTSAAAFELVLTQHAELPGALRAALAAVGAEALLGGQEAAPIARKPSSLMKLLAQPSPAAAAAPASPPALASEPTLTREPDDQPEQEVAADDDLLLDEENTPTLRFGM
ncbi:toprim domain-containing protein [Pseudoxanthomonas sp. LjRoot168]|uniref:toprim domain-containing protein n=1 Tax=unclassified Pseudoxanthomonas TaxID=2645906 RepID=UPI003ECFE408